MMRRDEAFTIVELLIVIVVIAILAAITIVAYNGIQNQARATVLQSDVSNGVRKIEAARALSSSATYPFTLAEAGFQGSPDTTLTYQPNGSSFCLVATNGTQTYSASSQSPSPAEGVCSNYNYALNGSVEDNASGWSASTGGGVERSNVRASHGSYSMRGYVAGSGTDRYIFMNVPVSGSGPWVVSADVYLTGTGAIDYDRGMWFQDNPTTIGTTTPYNTALINQWQQITRTVTSGPSTTSVNIRFYVINGQNIYVDNLRVEEAQ